MNPVIHGSTGFFVGACVVLTAAVLLPSSGCGLVAGQSADQVTVPEQGDVNGDGVVDQADLDLVTAAFGTREGDPLFDPQADLNGDGVIGLEDIQALIQILDTQGSAGG